MFPDVQHHLGEVQVPRTTRSGALTRVCPRELLFGNVVGTKVVRDDENRFLKLFPDVHDLLVKIHSLGNPGVDVLLLAVRGTWTSPRWSWTSGKTSETYFNNP